MQINPWIRCDILDVNAALKSAAIQCATVADQVNSRNISNDIFLLLSPPPLAFLDQNTPYHYLAATSALEAHTTLLLMPTNINLIPAVGTVLPAAFKTAFVRSPPLSSRSEYACHYTGVAKDNFLRFLTTLAGKLARRG